jgi:thiol-disulfide isomerase/thioredoxin
MKKHHLQSVVCAVIAVLLIRALPAEAAEAGDSSSAAMDKEACTAQLKKLHTAIQKYRQENKDLPKWLSDLVPAFVPDKNDLICPITRKTGRTHAFEHLKDPEMPKSYLYEFSPLPMGNIWNGGEIRMRDFKRRQMGLVGSEVPIVRCHLHDPVLNLSFGGRVYESGVTWEANFEEYVEPGAWQIASLFPESQRVPTAASAAAPTRQPRETEGPEQLVGKAAPEIKLPMLEGGTFDLAEQKGKKTVLLDFWATWCGPCRVAMPALVEIAKDYSDKGVVYYAVNLRESPDTIRRYLEDSKLKIQVPLDKDGSVAKKYLVRGIPTMVIVGTDGTVQKVHVGSSPNLKSEISTELDKLLSNSAESEN